MQVSLETTTGLERKLTVGIPASVVDQEVAKRLKEAAKTVRINGFRKGKVPMSVVQQRYGAGVRQEVLGDAINRSFYDAVRKESLRPAGQPAIEPKQLEPGKDIEFVATFDVYPEIEVSGLESIEVTRYNAEVTDADVDTMIETLQKSQADWAPVKRKSKKGDRVVIDFKGTKDGEAFEGGTAEGQTLVLGSNSMIPGFEKGIIGMKTGETETIKVTFPDDYQEESLRGAEAEFEVTVQKVEGQKLPKLDDEFFAKFGVTEGGEEKFRADVRENMEREKQKALKGKLKEQVMNGLVAANTVDIPKSLVSGEIDALRNQMGNQMMQQYGSQAEGIDFKSILPDDMFKEQAERRVALGLIVSEIVKNEKISVDKELVKSLIEDVASTYEHPEEVVNYYYGNEQLLGGVEAAALEEQVVSLVLSKAKVSDETISYEEAVKPAAKQAEE